MAEQDPLQFLLNMAADNAGRVDANRQAHTVVELSLLSFLVDAKIATIDQICQRIELIHSGSPPQYQTDEVKLRLKFVTDWLRGHEKRPRPEWTPEVIQGGLDQSAQTDDSDHSK